MMRVGGIFFTPLVAADDLQILRSWVSAGGGFVDKRLVLRQTLNAGRSLFVEADVAEGELLVWLPQEMKLLVEPVLWMGEQLLPKAIDRWAHMLDNGRIEEALLGIMPIAARLVLERRWDVRSRFHGYISTLPDTCPPNVARLTQADVAVVRGTELDWLEVYHAAARWALQEAFPSMSHDEVLWGVCLAHSRAFAENSPEVAMWPVLDLLNHAPEDRATAHSWIPHRDSDWDELDFELRALGNGTGAVSARALAPGEEFVWSYGEKSAVEMRLLYGFAPRTLLHIELPAPADQEADAQPLAIEPFAEHFVSELLATLQVDDHGLSNHFDRERLLALRQSCSHIASLWVRSLARQPASYFQMAKSTEAHELLRTILREVAGAERCGATVTRILEEISSPIRA